MKKQGIFKHTAVALLIVGLLISPTFGSMIEVKEMQFSFIGLPYYSSQTLGFSASTSLAGDVAIPTGPSTAVYAYTIQNAVVTLSNMSLSSGFGTSAGTFDGPATLTVTGNLVKKSTSTNLTGNVTLFEAQMDSSSLAMQQIYNQFAAGSALFTATSGALFDGVADGDDTIYLEDFGMGLWGSGVNVLFGDNSMSPYTAGVQITTDAVPEPATIGLLAMGILSLLRKRRNA